MPEGRFRLDDKQERLYGVDNAFHMRTMANTRGELLRKLWLAEQALEEAPRD